MPENENVILIHRMYDLGTVTERVVTVRRKYNAG